MTVTAEDELDLCGVVLAHARAQDESRIDDVVAAYAPDAVLHVPGAGRWSGHAELREAFLSWTSPAPQLHVVSGTTVTRCSGDAAEVVSEIVVLRNPGSGWAVQVVERAYDSLSRRSGVWRLVRRRVSFVQ